MRILYMIVLTLSFTALSFPLSICLFVSCRYTFMNIFSVSLTFFTYLPLSSVLNFSSSAHPSTLYSFLSLPYISPTSHCPSFTPLLQSTSFFSYLIFFLSSPHHLSSLSSCLSFLPSPSSLSFLFIRSLSQGSTTSNMLDVQVGAHKKRVRRSSLLNAKKLYEDAQMARKVKQYLSNLTVESDEEKHQIMSLQCEPAYSTCE